jgi:tRNA/tmRNA/rRNA uracil-C5-methylase (TrmA/RlmC/RlmD family)
MFCFKCSIEDLFLQSKVMNITNGSEIEVQVSDLAFGGRGVAKVETDDKPFTIFVDGGLPGQTLKIKITKKKRRYAEAKIIEVIKVSPLEIKHDFQPTPGASWLSLPIEIQQQHKQAQVFELFRKFADFDVAPIFDAYIESPEIHFYRNKMDYSFGPTTESFTEEKGNRGEDDVYKVWEHSGFGFGSKKRGQFWLVENLEKPSGLFDKDFEAHLPAFRILCERLNSSVYNAKSNDGFWRQLVVKKSFKQDAFLLNLITNHAKTIAGRETINAAIIKFWQDALGSKLKGFYWTQSTDTGNPNDKYQYRDLIFGAPTLTERICELDFDISIDSFFQTNIFSAEKLYTKIASYVPEATDILELFSGTGTISQILARQYPKSDITSVEIVEAAVTDAKRNAIKNSLKGINFVCEDVNKFMKTYTGTPPVVVLDPPRGGISPKALLKIIEFAPQEIIYVSCNAATLARDTDTLIKGGYALEKLSLVDQFPHTAHVECVAKFGKSQVLN